MAVNAQAVVNVQVNAQAFNAFMAQFNKWQTQLGKVPQQLQQIIALLNKMTGSMAAQTGIMVQQQSLLGKMAGQQKTLATHTEATGHHWKDMKKHAKDFLGFIGEAHAKIMKWAGIIGGVITGMGAATSWGLYGLAEWVRGGKVSASKVSLGSHELRALKGVLGDPYGLDVEGMARATAAAQGDTISPENQALQGVLGIDVSGMKGTRRVTAVYEAWRRKMTEEGWTPEEVARYSNGMLSADQGHILKNMTNDEFRKSIASVPESAEKQKVPADTEKHWNDFLTKLDEAGNKLKAVLVTGLEPILDLITKNSDKWIEKVKEFMAPGGPFYQFLETLPGRVERIGNLLVDLFHWLEWFVNKSKWLTGMSAPSTPGEKKFESDMKDADDWIKKYGPVNNLIKLFDYLTSEAGKKDIQNLNKPLIAGEKEAPQRQFQDGTPMVPKTGTYTLHKGEMVLPEAEADLLRHSSMEDWKRSISGIESGGNYGAVNRVSGASGKYQVMPANIADWTRQALGYSMSVEQFRANPAAQERVFETIFGQYVNRFGNPVDAAAAWFSGQPLTGNKAGPDAMGTTVPGYIKQFLAGLGANSGRMSVDINDNTGGNVAMALSQSALVSIPLHPI